jgi:hypothetical protein
MRAFAWVSALVNAAGFVALAAALLAPRSSTWVPALAILFTAVAVQVAFVGGVQAGAGLVAGRTGRVAVTALVLGWLLSLGALAVPWLRTTGMQAAWGVVLLAVSFAIDAWLVKAALLPRWFLAVRAVSTVAIVAATALAFVRA